VNTTFESLTDAQLGELYDRWQRIKAAGGPLITHGRIDWIVEKLRRSSYTPSLKENNTLDYARTMGLAALKRVDIDILNDIASKALNPVTIWDRKKLHNKGDDHDNNDRQANSDRCRSDTRQPREVV